MSEDSKITGVTGDPRSQYYGTFQGVANYQPPPPQPAVGFPQPVAPPAATGHPRYPQVHYHQGYQTVPGYAVIEGGYPIRERRLPFCGLGVGWLLFVLGFFLGGIPWYVGAFILLCVHVDYREKPGYVACMIATILALVAVTLGVSKQTHAW